MNHIEAIKTTEIEKMLKQYRHMKNKLESIQEEIELARALADTPELEESRLPAGCILALSKHAEVSDLACESKYLSAAIGKIDRCLTYLPEIDREVLQALYVEGRTYDIACDRIHISRSTLNKHRRIGIELLTKYI